MRQAYEAALQFFYVVFIAVTIFTKFSVVAVFFELAYFALIKWLQRLAAHRLASRSWILNKTVADYMHAEHTKSGSSYDPSSMKGFHYLVQGYGRPKLGARTLYSYATQATITEADAAGIIIDIDRIWQCKNLLILPFYSVEKALLRGLLAKNEGGAVDYNRAFKVVEVELSFMYDFFFSKRPAIYYGPWMVSSVLSFGLIVLPLVIAVAAVTHDRGLAHVRNWSPVATTATADRIITLVILACILLLELVQMLHYWTTIWGRVSVACHSVVRGHEATNTRGGLIFKCVRSIRENFIQICVPVLNKYYYRFPVKSKCYWQKKIGQYSLLESSGRSRPYFSSSRCSLVKPVKLIELPAQVTEALGQSIERTQGFLTNGESSLLSNGAGHLLWACRQEDMIHPADSGTSSSQKKEKLQVFVILTWHIATGYCERKYLCSSVGGALKKKHHLVATTLSKYCAYLVVSAPKLLPGHHFDTRLASGAVAREAIGFLQSEKDKHEAMSSRLPESRETPEPKETIFDKGVRLGKQLEGMEEGARWKVLADFWAEMLLYLSPSDNVKDHCLLSNLGPIVFNSDISTVIFGRITSEPVYSVKLADSGKTVLTSPK
ncbi:hypothetical protein C2845_PM04G00270 [Panicum miliaceum]|uniref:DUF4220 domain-containing protein n=1 Tax=Panicum miliaceum TaxID=4540 RepID=A0A3L6QNN3_PANMI|nr:hypothetical protein C2845_PM04G00270 [Panicum miliaceum]